MNWKPGEDVIIAGSVSDEEAKQKYPDGWKTPQALPAHRAAAEVAAARPGCGMDARGPAGATRSGYSTPGVDGANAQFDAEVRCSESVAVSSTTWVTPRHLAASSGSSWSFRP